MYDATSPYQVTIKQVDNDNAVRGDSTRCAIHCAIERVERGRGREVDAHIGGDKAYIYRGDRVIRYQVPGNEAALIRTFDALGVFPVGFTITLKVVRPAERLGARAAERGRKHRRTQPAEQTTRRLPTRLVLAPRTITGDDE